MCRRVMDELLDAEEEEQLPGIVSPHVYALLASDCSAFFEEMRAEAASATARDTLANAYDFLLSFMEEFTAHAAAIQARNQKLLAELLGAARRGALAFEDAIAAAREASRLDVTLLHYLDGEAARLRAAAGGDAALGAVGVIRARVAAEIDRTMGEEVSVLNRLLGFDDRFMMRSALRANAAAMTRAKGQRLLDLCRGTLEDVKGRGDRDPSLETKLADIIQDAEAMAHLWVDDAELAGGDAGEEGGTGLVK
eukprot:TRINITY_DN4056_c0_g1_i2.p2 TRINITY_DN4056_c0_g1~~TRINITY_DN4056_c0_g1_i2.p2  ORF type:complete len:252 (-),score=125.77 TRINITY_DN4056_c0_g1_i2:106-861(-)